MMALLITVIACDECRSTVGLKTDEDWQTYDRTWWDGFNLQFCPNCAKKPETQARRIADSRDIPAFVKPIVQAILSK